MKRSLKQALLLVTTLPFLPACYPQGEDTCAMLAEPFVAQDIRALVTATEKRVNAIKSGDLELEQKAIDEQFLATGGYIPWFLSDPGSSKLSENTPILEDALKRSLAFKLEYELKPGKGHTDTRQLEDLKDAISLGYQACDIIMPTPEPLPSPHPKHSGAPCNDGKRDLESILNSAVRGSAPVFRAEQENLAALRKIIDQVLMKDVQEFYKVRYSPARREAFSALIKKIGDRSQKLRPDKGDLQTYFFPEVAEGKPGKFSARAKTLIRGPISVKLDGRDVKIENVRLSTKQVLPGHEIQTELLTRCDPSPSGLPPTRINGKTCVEYLKSLGGERCPDTAEIDQSRAWVSGPPSKRSADAPAAPR